jgi:serine protease Do
MANDYRYSRFIRPLSIIAVLLVGLATTGRSAIAQQFNFERLSKDLDRYTYVLTMNLEISFGMQSNEQEMRMLATAVTEDGLVIFDGSSLEFDNPFSAFSSMTVKTTPTKIEITSLDGSRKYDGEYVGTDRYTKLGFARIMADEETKFDFVQFKKKPAFKVGEWVAVYMLMPEYVSPPLAADIGMVSSLVESPEYFPLTIGFGALETASVLFNENLEAVGFLGSLPDPSSTSGDNGSMMGGMNQFDLPLLGVLTADRIDKLIADPPVKGKVERGWLGITLQAATSDIQEFFGLDTESGGIVVNEIMKNSPAEQAGLLVGDIILSVNGQPVDVTSEDNLPVFQRKISDMGPDTQVEFAIVRPGVDGNDHLTVSATLGQAPIAATEADEYENTDLEFKVRNLVFTDYMMYNQDEDTFSGVVVSELEQGGLANVGGLQLGDVVQRIGSQPITSVEDVRTALEAIATAKPSEVIFFLFRNNKTMFVNVKTDWH